MNGDLNSYINNIDFLPECENNLKLDKFITYTILVISNFETKIEKFPDKKGVALDYVNGDLPSADDNMTLISFKVD